ncbi:TetR/AcrR family transcriptional regulator [Arthrobacter woluwensis]|uniref:Regulatory protein, tetR family n=1 Tax=Arthrobacter woluwensis TaxID=156980 RepID=A0A1H4KJU9_9MICC|nr:TetR/AcrR family transcriptional regulator [Arthrobacter woluwensis]SEB58192.1 regulatory protein, tetR family [Arthrobacter woluwensis]
MSTLEKSYHHGDLRAALLKAAIELLESGEPFSMRAVARRAGVSQTAPYRHFADRKALDGAVAVAGFRDLTADLAAALEAAPEGAAPADILGGLGVAYVFFALKRPAEFRIMFGNECDDADDDRVLAAAQLHAVLDDVLAGMFPQADVPNLSVAFWGMAHGLAFLHLDGKLRPENLDDVEARVRAAIAAVLGLGAPAPR